MEDFRLTAMRFAARAVARWRKDYEDKDARQMVIEHMSGIHGDIGPEFRAAYLTAFGG
jgi:hypothetical protein